MPEDWTTILIRCTTFTNLLVPNIPEEIQIFPRSNTTRIHFSNCSPQSSFLSLHSPVRGYFPNQSSGPVQLRISVKVAAISVSYFNHYHRIPIVMTLLVKIRPPLTSWYMILGGSYWCISLRSSWTSGLVGARDRRFGSSRFDNLNQHVDYPTENLDRLPVENNSAYRGSRFATMDIICPDDLYLFKLIDFSDDWALWSNTLLLNSELPTKFTQNLRK